MDNSVPSFIYTQQPLRPPSPFPTDIDCVLYPIVKWMEGDGVREGCGQGNGKLNSLIEVSS